MTFGADVPRRLHQYTSTLTYHIGVKPITCENDALDQTDYLPRFLAIITHPSLLTCTYRVNHFSEKEAPEGGKRTSTSSLIILYHHVPLPSHPHSLTLSDDEDEDVSKSEYYAHYYVHMHSPSSLHLFSSTTSLIGHFGVEIFRIIQNFPNLVALLSNLKLFFQKNSHRMKANSTKLSPFPLQFGVILKPLPFHFAPPLTF